MEKTRRSCFRRSWNKLSPTPSRFPGKLWPSARGWEPPDFQILQAQHPHAPRLPFRTAHTVSLHIRKRLPLLKSFYSHLLKKLLCYLFLVTPFTHLAPGNQESILITVVLYFQECYIHGVFWEWLLPLSMIMPLWFIQVAVCIYSWFLFVAEYHCIVGMCHWLFIHLPIEEYLASSSS